MAENHSDVLIVGAGVFGTSTAYHLASKHPSKTVTVIDRTPFPPEHAASTDINKIIRQDYTSAFYMALATEAMQAWESWPELGGKGYFHRTGWIHFGEKGSDMAERIRQNFAERGQDPSKDVTLEDARTQFNGIFAHADLDQTESAYWNPDAGWCDAGLATAELMKVATQRGVRYVQADVDGLVLGEGGIAAVQTKAGEQFSGKQILLATGAWTSTLMTGIEDELDLPEAERVESQVRAACVCVAHYKMGVQDLETLKAMPVTIYGEHGDAQPPPACNLLKFTNGHSLTNTITTKTGHKISAPPQRSQAQVGQALKDETWTVISGRLMPQFTTERPVEKWRLCWDAVSPTQDHLICQHPHRKLQNLYFAVGGSFHSYKFLPTVGNYVVNVLDGTGNGAEKDGHWAWKVGASDMRGAHEKAYPLRELRDVEGTGD